MTPAELAADVVGTVTVAGDEGWDAASLFHSGIGSPDVVVHAANVDDVRATVRYAAEFGGPVVVRGGGHSTWGTLPGGVVIDLSALTEVNIDGRRVSVGGGALWGEVAATLAPHGLAISSGDTASVGVGGLTLGGGIGWMVRVWGLACDQLVGAQVVTATGDVVEASADQHPDLFWALRGGGGNFGVVTRFDFAAHELASVVFTTLVIDGDPAEVVRALRDVMRDAPRELTVTYMDVPAMDPSAPAGATVTAVLVGDDVDAARSALAPVRAVAGVTEQKCGVRAYPDILLDAPAYDPENPTPGFVGGNILAADLDDDAVEKLVAFRARHDASVLFLRSTGGAFSDVAADATAFSARDAQWFAMAGAFVIPGVVDIDEAATAAEWSAIETHGVGSYGNFTDSVDRDFVRKMYAPPTWERLAAIKREWDPQNLFSRTHNVIPA